MSARFAAAIALCALSFGLIAAVPLADAGPDQSVAQVRHDVPLLFSGLLSSPVAVDRVVTDGAFAAARWSAGSDAGLALLRRRYDRWWMVAESNYYNGDWTTLDDLPPGKRCGKLDLDTPSASEIAGRFGFPPSLARASVEGIVAPTPAELPATAAADFVYTDCPSADRRERFVDGFAITLHGAPPFVAATMPRLFVEEALAADGSADAPKITLMPIAAGEMRDFSLDLWYPYVLENKATYRMVVQDGGRGIQASRTGNTLHFALPAIALVPGTGVRLEIAHDR